LGECACREDKERCGESDGRADAGQVHTPESFFEWDQSRARKDRQQQMAGVLPLRLALLAQGQDDRVEREDYGLVQANG
jgi:hypothetical protein